MTILNNVSFIVADRGAGTSLTLTRHICIKPFALITVSQYSIIIIIIQHTKPILLYYIVTNSLLQFEYDTKVDSCTRSNKSTRFN